jgi:crossover junction endodeoxyribonuclease RusA
VNTTDTIVADFTVPGIVKSESKKQRPFKLPNGQIVGMGPRTDDKPQASFKAKVALFGKQAMSEPLHGPVALSLFVTRPQPKSYPKKPTSKYPWPWADMAMRRDVDNVAKLMCDALTGVAYSDDSQIVDLRVTRGWGEHAVRVVVKSVSIEEAAA